jgi:Kef-type K+ transport system membrane component KefB
MAEELSYIGLLAGLFIVPKIFQRYRIPAPITALAIGILAGRYLPQIRSDHTVALFSSLGILALFLFAGMEVQLEELKKNMQAIGLHLAVRTLGVGAASAIAIKYFSFDWRAAVLVALAFFTPSTGFILDSLGIMNLTDPERRWIKTKAIAAELLALGAMFVVLQSTSSSKMLGSAAALAALVAGIPFVFGLYARYVLPFAPKTEFAFLLIVAILSGYLTKYLGAYYLVGAFLVGISISALRHRLPSFYTESNHHAVEVFSSLFVPFYFFHAGLTVPTDALRMGPAIAGLLAVLVLVPLRVMLIAVSRHYHLGESWRASLRVAAPLMPTLVFTLVLSSILYESRAISDFHYGALIFYTVLNSVVAPVLLGLPVLQLDIDEDHARRIAVDRNGQEDRP